MTKKIITSGGFDNLCSKQVRFLHEISKFGQVHLLLLSDELLGSIGGTEPKFPLPERQYYLQSIRYVNRIYTITDLAQLQNIPQMVGEKVDLWFTLGSDEIPLCRQYAETAGIEYRLVTDEQLAGFPENETRREPSSKKKVIATGCFDWFHSGHVRFFEEACEYGDLFVVVGHDKNIELLKKRSGFCRSYS